MLFLVVLCHLRCWLLVITFRQVCSNIRVMFAFRTVHDIIYKNGSLNIIFPSDCYFGLKIQLPIFNGVHCRVACVLFYGSVCPF